ncbi:MAG: prepilin-type N-terminal cleavage/methylation domain-containing protein [Candidatus Omnitrophica bacterium]|nr:prepilin-type N-terminal cleavage/methylation domain-containing protein [Candidatus Omnitrophota bacterium]
MRSDRGFTIIELLLAITLFSIASVSLYFNFQTGIFLHSRVGHGLERLDEYRLCFDKIDKELHNIVAYDDVVFKGQDRSISFPAFIEVYEKGERHSDFYQITYELKNKALYRIMRSLRKKGLSGSKEHKDILLSGLQGGSFEYAYRTPAGSLAWKDLWDTGEVTSESLLVPYGIRLSIKDAIDTSKDTTGSAGAPRRETDKGFITKTFTMPVGTLFEVKLNE